MTPAAGSRPSSSAPVPARSSRRSGPAPRPARSSPRRRRGDRGGRGRAAGARSVAPGGRQRHRAARRASRSPSATPVVGRPPPGAAPANPIRGRFAQQQQRGGVPAVPAASRSGQRLRPQEAAPRQEGQADHDHHARPSTSASSASRTPSRWPTSPRNMGIKATEVLKKLWGMGMTGVNINAAIDFDTAQILASEFGYEVQNVAFKEEDVFAQKARRRPRSSRPRAPGRHRHGSRRPRQDVAARRDPQGPRRRRRGRRHHPAHRRLQGAGRRATARSSSSTRPGHEAFTAMRARGAQATDIVVLVVAADDGVMPQTARGARPRQGRQGADHRRGQQDRHARRAARSRAPAARRARPHPRGVGRRHDLRQRLGAQAARTSTSCSRRSRSPAEVLELKANPDKPAAGLVIEARLDRNRGPMATVLVQEGTLRVGDIVVAGRTFGKVRAMLDDRGEHARPRRGRRRPVEVLGLDGVPDAGDQVNAAEDEKVAKQVVEHRRQQCRKRELASTREISLESLMERNSEGAIKELEDRPQGGRPGLGRGAQGRAHQADHREGPGQRHPRRRRRHHRVRRQPREGGRRDHRRLPRPPGRQGSQARRAGGRRDPPLRHHLRGARRGEGGDGRPARADQARGRDGQARGPRDLHDPEDGHRRRLHGHRRARSPARPTSGSSATRSRSTRAGSAACAASRTTSARSQHGFECGVMVEGCNDIKSGDIIEAYEVIEEAAQL